MRFLCLHGAIGNAKGFSIQLGPLEKELATDQAASFCYITGLCKVEPRPGFEDYFGIGPHYRWFNDDGRARRMLDQVRLLPVGESPEDVIRALRASGDQNAVSKSAADGIGPNHQELFDYLYEVLETHPEIEGVVGYSEGAGAAASLIVDEMKRFQEEGRPRRIKCAIFFAGWPPMRADEELVLSDESPLIIDIPTLHIIGANDPFKCGGRALYNVCDEDTATLFDTVNGHTLPRAGLVLQELGNAIRELISLVPLHEGK